MADWQALHMVTFTVPFLEEGFGGIFTKTITGEKKPRYGPDLF